MSTSKTVLVTQCVTVEVDEKKFTEEWMAEFRRCFYEFHTVDDHIRHLATLYSQGFADGCTTFLEGYGEISYMGIKVTVGDVEEVDIQ